MATKTSLSLPTGFNTSSSSGFASLQTPSADKYELPSWLSPNPNDQLGELIDSYGKIPAAYDTTNQVAANNRSIAYNTSAGTQMANNAATEYSNRAAQSGASGLGAGVVKAQSMMPVLAMNTKVRADSANIAAKASQEAATLASQVAGTIGQLRIQYLTHLTGYAENKAQLDFQNQQAQQNQALQRQQLQGQSQAGLASLLNTVEPGYNYGVDNQGKIMYGHDSYNNLMNWRHLRDTGYGGSYGRVAGNAAAF
jgi:hypothetical protein